MPISGTESQDDQAAVAKPQRRHGHLAGANQGVNDDAFHAQFRDCLRDEARILMSLSPSRSRPVGPRGIPESLVAPTRSSSAKQKAAGAESGTAAGGASPSPQPRQLQRPQRPQGVAFREALTRKYGSVVGAWRVLDPLDHGRLSFNDLCRATRQLGYLCDAQALWQALDVNKDGFVTIEEIDYGLADLLFGFALVITEVCRSADSAWRKHFGGSRVGRCQRDRFVQVAAALGYDGDANAVYVALNADRAMGGVLYKDFRLLDSWFKEIIGDHKWRYEILRPTCCGADLRLPASTRGV